MVSYRRALRPVWIAAVVGATVVAITVVAAGTPANPSDFGPQTAADNPLSQQWGAVVPDLTPIGLPYALLPPTPNQVWPGIRGSRIVGQPPCSYPRTAGDLPVYVYEAITELRVCGLLYEAEKSTMTSVSVENRYGAADFQNLARAMAKPDRFQSEMCPMMAIVGPLVYAHTESGWWLVQQPMDGCWPDYQLLSAILVAHQEKTVIHFNSVLKTGTADISSQGQPR